VAEQHECSLADNEYRCVCFICGEPLKGAEDCGEGDLPRGVALSFGTKHDTIWGVARLFVCSEHRDLDVNWNFLYTRRLLEIQQMGTIVED